ncbi:hypothetical protein LZK35_30555, partial [Pseudomonas aeruginosa]|nr:hypothetical protein [Pseudomonas aeruginosa]
TAWARLRFYAGVLDEADLELVAANFRDHSRTKEI